MFRFTLWYLSDCVLAGGCQGNTPRNALSAAPLDFHQWTSWESCWYSTTVVWWCFQLNPFRFFFPPCTQQNNHVTKRSRQRKDWESPWGKPTLSMFSRSGANGHLWLEALLWERTVIKSDLHISFVFALTKGCRAQCENLWTTYSPFFLNSKLCTKFWHVVCLREHNEHFGLSITAQSSEFSPQKIPPPHASATHENQLPIPECVAEPVVRGFLRGCAREH